MENTPASNCMRRRLPAREHLDEITTTTAADALVMEKIQVLKE